MSGDGYLGIRTKVGVQLATNKILSGAWVVTFDADDLPREAFEVYHGALTGPGGYARVYLDETLEDMIQNGRINAYDPNHPMFCMPGQIITIHWSTAAGSAPIVILKLQKPTTRR